MSEATQIMTFGDATFDEEFDDGVVTAQHIPEIVETEARQRLNNLEDDVATLVDPFLSMKKIALLQVHYQLKPNEDDQEILEEATPQQLADAEAKISETLGKALTTIGDKFLRKAGFETDDFTEIGRPDDADDTVVVVLKAYFKMALRIQLGFPIPQGESGKEQPFDSARIATGLRTVMDVITPSGEETTTVSVRVYNNKNHVYSQLSVQFGPFWTVLTSGVLSLRPAAHVEGDTLLALSRLSDRFDLSKANKKFVTLGNGDLDLETFGIVPFDPDHLTTYALPIVPNTANTKITPAWQQFFDGQWEDDDDTVRFILRWLAVHLLPFNVGVFVITFNKGGGGKTLLNAQIRNIVGPGLAASVPASQFSRNFGPEMLLASDRSTVRKANVVDENGAQLPWNFMKNVADEGAVMTIDRKNLTALTLPIETKFTLATNTLAGKNDDTEQTYAAERKTRLLVFPKSFLPEEQDLTLGTRMTAELNDMAGLFIQELKAMKEEGSFTPAESETMRANKAIWFASMTEDDSPVARFIAEQMQKDVGKRLSRTQILSKFNVWLEETDTASDGYNKPKRFWPKFRELVPTLLHTSAVDDKSGNDYYFNDVSFKDIVDDAEKGENDDEVITFGN